MSNKDLFFINKQVRRYNKPTSLGSGQYIDLLIRIDSKIFGNSIINQIGINSFLIGPEPGGVLNFVNVIDLKLNFIRPSG